MKATEAVVAFLLFAPLAFAAPLHAQSLDLGEGFSVQLPTLPQIETVNTLAIRDLKNGQWLVGYGHEIGYLMRGGDEIAFADGWNAFNTDDGKGVFGVSFGVHPTAAVMHTVNAITGNGAAASVLPPWLKKSNSWESIEIGAGDRIFGGGGPGVSNFCYGFGFEVSIPFGQLFGVSGSL